MAPVGESGIRRGLCGERHRVHRTQAGDDGTLGNKVAGAQPRCVGGVPVMPATDPLPDDAEQIKHLARTKRVSGHAQGILGRGGRGMVRSKKERLADTVLTGKREAKSAFGKDDVYLEKLVRQRAPCRSAIPRHPRQPRSSLRARLLDSKSVTEVIERRRALCRQKRAKPCATAALAIGKATNYVGAGTVEF